MGVFSWLTGNDAPPANEDEARLLAALAEAEPRLALYSGWQKRLLPAVRVSWSYARRMVDALPGPICVCRHAFAEDPLVHALFASAADIPGTLAKSRELRQFLAKPGVRAADKCYALLGMRRQEKKVLGAALWGDLVRGDSPQTLLYFIDHTLRGLSVDLDDTRRQLQQAAFDGLLQGLRRQREDMQMRRDEIHGRLEFLRAKLKVSPADTAMSAEMAACKEEWHKLNEHLAPNHLLDDFEAWFMNPAERLRLDPVEVTVDGMGVEAEKAMPGRGWHTLNFPELVGRDRRRWIVVLIAIPMDEAFEALERQEQASRYIVI